VVEGEDRDRRSLDCNRKGRHCRRGWHACAPGSILEAAQLLARANDDPKLLKGVFYRKLDVTQIGAMGHSQGAEAAIAALMQSNGFIKTVVPFELPAVDICGSNCIDITQFTRGSIFFVTGTDDLIAPPDQCECDHKPNSVRAYYDLVPNSVAKVMGALFAYGHSDILGQPDCGAIPGCYVGVYGYLGYPTAWMMYQLKGDAYAGSAFKGRTAEIDSDSEFYRWQYVGIHNLR